MNGIFQRVRYRGIFTAAAACMFVVNWKSESTTHKKTWVSLDRRMHNRVRRHTHNIRESTYSEQKIKFTIEIAIHIASYRYSIQFAWIWCSFSIFLCWYLYTGAIRPNDEIYVLCAGVVDAAVRSRVLERVAHNIAWNIFESVLSLIRSPAATQKR